MTISLPDDLAEMLEKLPPRSVSGYVAAALRHIEAARSMRTILAAAGYPDFPLDPQGAQARLQGLRVPDSVVQRAREQYGLDERPA